MMIRCYRLVLPAVILFTGGESFSQDVCTFPVSRNWIHLTETTGFMFDTLWFGFDQSATYGLDTHLCESEIPAVGPDSRFMNIPGRIGLEPPDGLGSGVYYDFRQYHNASQIDTHAIAYGVNWSTVYAWRWSPASIRTICDSAVLTDQFGGVLLHKRLDLEDSLFSTSHNFSLILIRYGAITTPTDVEPKDEYMISSYELAQNYPNPFNPSTMINYELSTGNWVTLRVYNILGQEVRTLVNERKDAGEHRVEFNAEGLPSGVYVYRIQSGNYVQSRKMILLR